MNSDWIAILADPLPLPAAIEFCTNAGAGAVSVFVGTTRKETNATGRDLLALDYEAYAEMALAQMQQLARLAHERWDVAKLVMLHRTGRVTLGHPSVLIAVSTPHRDQAFEACRFLIDELKKDATIWKKQIWTDGSQRWVHPEARV